MSRLGTRTRRWAAAIGTALLLALAVALAVVHLPHSIAAVGDTSETLLRNLVTAAVLGALAYLWFSFWTSDRTTHKLLLAAQREPERLFPQPRGAGAADRVYGRSDLIKEIANGMRPPLDTGPQIIVGETGAGKTSLLLALAAHLAREHRILPIVLNLSEKDLGVEQLDFRELAMERFRELIDPYIRTEAEVDKLWRWLCHRDQIAILIDDLDRSVAASQDASKAQIRLALGAAGRRKLPLVVATRPSGLPPDLPDPPIDLTQQPLREEGDPVWKKVLGQAGRPESDAAAQQLVSAYLEAGSLLENPFYIDLVTRLLRAGVLQPTPAGGKHAVRIALLDAERDRVCGGAQIDRDEYARRDEALRQLESFAAASLPPESTPTTDEWLTAIVHGERFGLLSLDEKGPPRFVNEVLHAYLASRAIAGSDAAGLAAAVKEAPNAPRVQLALVFAAGADKDQRLCSRACDALLDKSAAATADDRLLRAAAAAEVTRAGAFSERDEEIACHCIEARAGAGPVAKRAALEQIQLLGSAGGVEALWCFTEDDDYDTRWSAVDKLVRRCATADAADSGELRAPLGEAAYWVIASRIETALDEAAPLAGAGLDDWDPRIFALKRLGWMLPALRSRATRPDLKREIDGQLKRLLDLEEREVTPQRGLEASIAQGFKADAVLDPDGPLDEDALEMLERAAFWYSQLNLVHALALRIAGDRGSGPESLTTVLRRMESRGPLHPLLAFASRLCVKALQGEGGEERLARVKFVVWDDEGAMVSGRPTDLAPAARQLVGEVAVLLNLNETGDFEKRRRFGEEVSMPYCLQRSRNRDEFQAGCDEACELRLCPFQPARDRLSAHREISRAFCRHQRHNASRKVARKYGSRVRRRALREFWRRLEAQARF